MTFDELGEHLDELLAGSPDMLSADNVAALARIMIRCPHDDD